MNLPRNVQSMFGYLALAGGICSAGLPMASPSAAQETQDVEGAWGEWKPVPATVGPDGHRRGAGVCPLEIGTRALVVRWEAWGHPVPSADHPDEARTELSGGQPQALRPLLTSRNAHVRLEFECGTAENTDLVPLVTEWKPVSLNGPSEFEFCPEERPYLQNARCQTRTTVTVQAPVDAGKPDEEESAGEDSPLGGEEVAEEAEVPEDNVEE